MYLPARKGLPVNLLAACFNNTSATYKYYWFLSLLQAVEEDKSRISKRDLFARMISNAWFTVNYFHVSFGKQDKLQRAIEQIKNLEPLTIDDNREKIFVNLKETRNDGTIKHLKYFDKQVPHWFLSPWFSRKDKGHYYLDSQKFKGKCLYALYKDEIMINPEWFTYLKENTRVLKDFCYWNLATYLQAKNPNVPDIPNKLIKPAIRNSLINQRKFFWDVVIKELGTVECIYTGNRLTVGDYTADHFVPYSFVSHDLVWNLIPVDKSSNSTKSDRLPKLEKHFEPFYKLHKQAIEIITHKAPKNKFLEDYLTILPDISKSFTMENFRARIQPLITIASNNGFEFMR